MPGPGGGARGGGGGRGGFGGGSHGGFGGGGGFGGPRPGGHGPRGGFHGPHMGGWHHRPRHWGWGWHRGPHYGGGCLGGLMGIIMVPLILIILLIAIIGSVFTGGLSANSQGSSVQYDEEALQDYADDRYAEIFSSSAYEDNLLIVFLIDEGHYNYSYIAWVGDHIADDINFMFGSNSTQLGQAMSTCINETNYKYSLDSNLAQVFRTMTTSVTNLGISSSFTCKEERTASYTFINDTELQMTKSTVEDALKTFSESTGIPTALVVDDMADVFPKNDTSALKIGAIVLIVVVAVIIIVTVSSRKRKKSDDDRYSSFDNQR